MRILGTRDHILAALEQSGYYNVSSSRYKTFYEESPLALLEKESRDYERKARLERLEQERLRKDNEERERLRQENLRKLAQEKAQREEEMRLDKEQKKVQRKRKKTGEEGRAT